MNASRKARRTTRPLAALFAALLSTAAFAADDAASIARGRALFMTNCTACHGNDGKSLVEAVSDATDLTEPKLYRSGSTDADIERSIRDGVGGVMPPWGPVLGKEQSVRDLRNFIKSLWAK